MTVNTTSGVSAADQYALKSLNLRTPLASYADPSSVPVGSGPLGQGTGAGSVPFGATASGGDQDDMVCRSGDPVLGGGTSPGSGPYTTDAALPYPLTWSGMPAGTGVVVSGGTYGVNTNDLTSFATTLCTAADWLEDARDLALACLTDLRCDGFGVMMYSQPNIGANGSWNFGFNSAHEAITSGGAQCYSPVSDSCATERANAIAALQSLTSGAGSLDDAADSLRTLATAVTLSAATYTDTESGMKGRWLLMLQTARLGIKFGGGSHAVIAAGIVGALAVLSADGAALPDGMDDALQGLEMLLGDPMLDDWVNTDLMILLALAIWAKQAKTGLEAASIETYIGQVAEELDPAISAMLPDQVPVGSRMVDTASLTPMQRVVYYLAVRAEQSGAYRYGEPTGVTVTPHGGQSVTVPPGVRDPFGLGTAVPAVAAALPQSGTGPQPGTVAEVIRYSDDMKGRDEDTSSGVVSILRTDHADGTTSWLVVVPGTTDWGSGNTNPQDLLTNLQAVSGRPTDMETAVVTAMREAGIAPGDKVGLYGHSQGAITASNIAADSAVAEQFNITNLLTAGGPTAGANLPESVNAIHLENTGDAVPALDAAPTPRTPTRTVVTIDTHAAGVDGYPHAPQIYADAVDGMHGNPQIDQWTEELGGITGAGEDGAKTTEIIFDITRDSPETTWEQVAQGVGKQG
ncbi:hypothetical protein CWT12_00470 [Actinomyces sp. 432]|uniref:hypothetical protein n=1 Tax=Actinomyces sp. 432 TaxID=2057798 RepID=UPI001373CDAA|nr:hypothetical protein [Actinomyces sp. 432]QHO90116.1 hypothetical protein CWT12_00470 [Actinomyces sp. 432]